MNVLRALLAGLKAFVGGPTAQEQQVDALLAALWKERAQQDRRREQLNAVVRVTEGRR